MTATRPADAHGKKRLPDDAAEAGIPRYLAIKEMAALLGTEGKNLQQVLKIDQGLHVLDPDVVAEAVKAKDTPAWGPESAGDPDRIVGGQRGWAKERVIAWGIEIGRLNPDGTVNPSARSWRLPDGPLP